ncbi:copper amine oxidase N-terminal domain-containing protein [Bacillus sp. Marseille-P3661]|uniref:copper amine oxidase N-terminal domain-containing protein n=1 Tax=Bacillus sp. Marseille-P3661 TaxID=1936234 RepID=UPI000C828B4F|nr:copper amine oxidase N-terminal domain-containing protein [Bacillus sp. Marseille-P3661]
MNKFSKIITTVLASVAAMNITVSSVLASTELPSQDTIIEASDFTVIVNGSVLNFDVPPVVKNGRTLVPLRAIFESLGASVKWDTEAQTITALRLGRTISLTANSNIAMVNGLENKFLDVPAIIYKDRTLVPLRFSGEVFDGTVDWDETTKTITIEVPEENIADVDSPIYVNNKLLNFEEVKPIRKNDSTYIPLDPVLENITGETHWFLRDDTIVMQVDGAYIELYVDKNYALVDGHRIDLPQPPIRHDDNILIPMSLITNALGGSSQYNPETKEVFIYVNRPKFKHEFLEKEEITFATPTNVEDAKFVGNRRLMVSDNPENLNSRTIQGDNVTLWEDEVKSEQQTIDHRVFAWHINEFGSDVSIGITIENLSTTNEIEVVDLKGTHRQTPNGWVNYDVGLPLAEYTLSNDLTNVKMKQAVLQENDISLMNSFNLKSKQTIGFLYDFTVKRKSGTGELDYKIRTVLSKNGEDLTTITSDPVDIDQTALHPRGVWSSSELETELPAYTVDSGEIGHQISNGKTDHLMSVENAISDESLTVRNPGHFGASYKVKIPIINDAGVSKTVRVRVGGRGGIYNGAVKVDGKVYLIPTLTPMKEVANVIDYVVNQRNDVIELEIMHAGGAALPLSINLVTLED